MALGIEVLGFRVLGYQGALTRFRVLKAKVG